MPATDRTHRDWMRAAIEREAEGHRAALRGDAPGARAAYGRAVEAYPRSETGSDPGAYRGPLEMYLRSGFEPYREAGRTLIVRKPLA